MELFHIPFTADGSHGWTVPVPGDGEKQFASRKAALAYATSLARTERAEGESTYLCIEGGDGQWRLFTPDLLPVG